MGASAGEGRPPPAAAAAAAAAGAARASRAARGGGGACRRTPVPGPRGVGAQLRRPCNARIISDHKVSFPHQILRKRIVLPNLTVTKTQSWVDAFAQVSVRTLFVRASLPRSGSGRRPRRRPLRPCRGALRLRPGRRCGSGRLLQTQHVVVVRTLGRGGRGQRRLDVTRATSTRQHVTRVADAARFAAAVGEAAAVGGAGGAHHLQVGGGGVEINCGFIVA